MIKLFISSLIVFTLLSMITIAFAHLMHIKLTFVGLALVTAILAFRMAYDVIYKKE